MPPPVYERFDFARVVDLHKEIFDGAFSDACCYDFVSEKYDGFCDRALEIMYRFEERRPEGFEDLATDHVSHDHVTEGFLKPTKDKQAAKPNTSRLWSKRANIFGEMLFNYYGREINSIDRDNISWRIAACFKQLKRFKPIERDFKPIEPAWYPARIEDARHGAPTKAGKPTISATFRLFDGPFGGLTFVQRMPYKYWMYVIKRALGFPAYKRLHKNEFAQARIAGLLDTTEGYRFSEFFPSSGMQAFNRDLRKSREAPCLYGYKWACIDCTRGHSLANYERAADGKEMYSDCERATHSMTFKKGMCPRCKRDDAWFDVGDKICVTCKADQNRSAIRLATYGG